MKFHKLLTRVQIIYCVLCAAAFICGILYSFLNIHGLYIATLATVLFLLLNPLWLMALVANTLLYILDKPRRSKPYLVWIAVSPFIMLGATVLALYGFAFLKISV